MLRGVCKLAPAVMLATEHACMHLFSRACAGGLELPLQVAPQCMLMVFGVFGFCVVVFLCPCRDFWRRGVRVPGAWLFPCPSACAGPIFFGGRSGLGDPRLAGLVPVSAFRSLFGPRLGPASGYQLPLFDLSLSVATHVPRRMGCGLVLPRGTGGEEPSTHRRGPLEGGRDTPGFPQCAAGQGSVSPTICLASCLSCAIHAEPLGGKS